MMNHATTSLEVAQSVHGKAVSNRAASRGSLLAILTIGLGGLGWLWIQAAYNPAIAFLPRLGTAQWILYPRPNWLIPHTAAPLDATFRRSFHLSRLPRSATLRWRAFRKCRLLLNGKELKTTDTDGDWKRVRQLEVTGTLHEGDNTLRAIVVNDDGPPAFWLQLDAGDMKLVTDRQWQVSFAGAEDVNAVSSHLVPPGYLGTQRLYRTQTWSAAQRVKVPLVLMALVALSVAAVTVYRTSLSRATKLPGASYLRFQTALILWLGVATVWSVLVINNHSWLTSNMGFDSLDHLDYIAFIQQHRSLPLAEDGREMHQPPLFYAMAAGLLSLFGADPHSEAGLAIVRGFAATLGALHFGLIFACLRLVFPGHPRRAVLGLLFAAVLPMHLYIFQYISNESLTAVLSAAVFYTTLRMVRSETVSMKIGAMLGVLLGAALLSKITTLVLVPVVLTVLAARLVTRRCSSWRAWGATVLLPLVICMAVSGWQYYRNWSYYGTPLVRHISLPGSGGAATWKDPGMRDLSDFFRFGQSLNQPFLVGFRSFADAMYSTYFGDGRCGGRGDVGIRPAWNYDLMAAGYLLALVPLFAMMLGLVLAVRRMVLRPDAVWYLLIGVLFSMLFALVYEALRHPYLTVCKAWYGLPATVALCAMLAWGADWVAHRGRWPCGAMYFLLGLWGLNSLASFWIPAGSPRALVSVGMAYAEQEREGRASKYLSAALNRDPRNAVATWQLGRLMSLTGKDKLAGRFFNRALKLDPRLSGCALDMAVSLRRQGKIKKARQYARRAVQLAPDEAAAYRVLGDLLARGGDLDGAIESFVKILPLRPTDPTIHARLAVLYDRRGHATHALEHARRAVVLTDGLAEYRVRYAGLLVECGHAAEGIAEYERALKSHGDRASVASHLAWVLATYPDETIRDGRRAVELAKQSVDNQPGNAYYWRTLGAAYGETGRFREAAQAARRSLELLHRQNIRQFDNALAEDLRRYARHERMPVVAPAPPENEP